MSVRVEPDEPVIVVTLDRPEVRNAVDAAHAAASRDADADAAVAVLYGAGGTFCADADLQALAAREPRPLADDGPGPMAPAPRAGQAGHRRDRGARGSGRARAGAGCDLRVPASDAVLGVFCRRVGVPLVDLGTVRLPRLVGQGRALDLLLTGRGVTGEEL